MSNGQWGKIAIGVRMDRRGGDPFFFRSIMRVRDFGCRPGDCMIDPVVEMLPHVAANILVDQFLKTSADTLCFIDDDMVFPSDILSVMRDALGGNDFDIMQAVCVSRRWPHRALAWIGDIPVPTQPAGIIPMTRAGLGFTFIRRNVFEVVRMERPNKMLFCFPEDGRGEDVYFVDNALQLGFKTGLCMAANVGHRFPLCGTWNVEKGVVEFDDGHDALTAKGRTK